MQRYFGSENIRPIWTAVVILLCSVAIPISFSTAQGKTTQRQPPIAELVSPKDGESVSGHVPCPDPNCPRIDVDGRVAKGYTPFLAVGPLSAAPSVWIQAPIVGIRSDGRFSSSAYLGEPRRGAGERYDIFVLAAKDPNKFKEGQVLRGLPREAEVFVGEPVTVIRTK